MKAGIFTTIGLIVFSIIAQAQSTVQNQKFSVLDQTPPVAVCDGSEQISLTSIPTKVFASTFDDGSYDETCFSHFLVKRMGEPDASFKSFIEFTCNDVAASPIKVVLQVVDCSGNFNDCWSNAFIEDKTKPTVLCSPDVTINCNEDVSKYWGTPIASDNCGNVTITSNTIDATDQCQSGYISKIWTVKDQYKNQSTCTQKIYLKHISDYSVTFPNDVTITQCISPDDLKNTGTPVFTNKDCELAAVGFTDHDLPITDGNGCFVRIRKWQIINWCNYDPNKSTHTNLGIPQGGKKYKDDDGYFEYTQYIKVFETGDPKLTCKDSVVCITDNTCLASFTIHKPKVVDCSTNINYQISGDLGASLNAVDIPIGVYSIKHNVSDGCGNHSFCDLKITVKDCKKPTPVVINGLSTTLMVQSASTGVWASDFNQSSFDNCTPSSKLKYSFSKNIQDVFKTFTCDSIGLRTVKIWVTDESGNQDFAVTTIDIQDNMNACDTTGTLMKVTGAMTLFGGQAIEDAGLDLASFQAKTDSSGTFNFPWVNLPLPAKLIVTKQEKANDKINVMDIIMVTNHLLGKKQLSNYIQMDAADVNRDKNIGTGDLVQMRHMILGLIDKWPNSEKSWLCALRLDSLDTKNSYKFFGPENEMLIDSSFKDSVALKLIAYKLGSVSSSAAGYSGKVGKRNSADFTIQNGNKLIYSGDLILQGAQFSLNFDTNPENMVAFCGEITTNQSGKNGKTELKFVSETELNPGQVILEWANKLVPDQIRLTNSIDPIAVDQNFNQAEVVFVNPSENSGIIKSVEVFPNPASDFVNLVITSDKPEKTVISLLANDGRVVYFIEKDLERGSNNIKLNLPVPKGTYVITIKTETDSYTKKITRID